MQNPRSFCQKKRRRVQKLMLEDEKEVMLRKRVSVSTISSQASSASITLYESDDVPSTSISCPKTFQVGTGVPDNRESEIFEQQGFLDSESMPIETSSESSYSSDSSDSIGSLPDVLFSENSSSDEEQPDIANFLKEWYHSTKSVPRQALTDLLKGLKAWFPELPSDARTLLGTPRSVNVVPMGSGTFHHFGLRSSIENQLQTFDHTKHSVLHLHHNIDGMQLYKSTNEQFWPILCFLEEDPKRKPFTVSLFCGPTKPPVNEFLSEFVSEMFNLQNDGFIFNNCHFTVNITCFTCDAPARSFVKGIKAHNSYYGCDRCIQKGEWKKRVIFPEAECELRTNESFRNKVHSQHHKEDSLLLQLDVDMVKDFPHDYMHLVCLGVMRRLLMIWCGKARTHVGQLSSSHKHYLNSFLSEIQSSFPSEFNRNTRPVRYLDYWKATEFRSFLLYLSPVCLKNVLSKNAYDHFLLFFCGITILISEGMHLEKNDLAAECLKAFVEKVPEHYGSEYLVYNVHSLVHLSSDAANFGPLDSFSAFPFENFLHSLKNMIFKSTQPLQQVVNKMEERKLSKLSQTAQEQQTEFHVLENTRTFSQDASSVLGTFYSEIKNDKYKLSIKDRNSYILTNKNKIFKIVNFVVDINNEIFVIGKIS